MPDSYVVHIYRREPAERRMTGTVERVGNGGRVGFASADELWSFLAAERSERSVGRQPTRSGSKRSLRSAAVDAAFTQPKEKKS